MSNDSDKKVNCANCGSDTFVHDPGRVNTNEYVIDGVSDFKTWAKCAKCGTPLANSINKFGVVFEFRFYTQPKSTISHFQIHDTLKGNGSDSYWYQFCSSKPISKDLSEKISVLIEQQLNQSI